MDSDDLEMIKLYYNYSTKKALQGIAILTPSELDHITRKVTRGIKHEHN